MADEPKPEDKQEAKPEPKKEEVKPSASSSAEAQKEAAKPEAKKEEAKPEPKEEKPKAEAGSNGNGSHKLTETLASELREEKDRRAKLEERLLKLEKGPEPPRYRLVKPMFKGWKTAKPKAK